MLKKLIAASAVVAFLVLGALVGTSTAQSPDECVFDGDLQSYLACVAGDGVTKDPNGSGDPGSASLARTGSDVGASAGIGGALVILGAAVVFGVNRQRRSATS